MNSTLWLTCAFLGVLLVITIYRGLALYMTRPSGPNVEDLKALRISPESIAVHILGALHWSNYAKFSEPSIDIEVSWCEHQKKWRLSFNREYPRWVSDLGEVREEVMTRVETARNRREVRLQSQRLVAMRR